MTAKKETKAKLIEIVLDREEAIIKGIVKKSPGHLRHYIRGRMGIDKKIKGDLERLVMDQETYIIELDKVHVFPLTRVIPENVVLDEDDPLLPIIEVANETYGDDLVMNYYKIPIEDFGDTLAKFIAAEVQSVTSPADSTEISMAIAAGAICRAAEQLMNVASALESKAREMHKPEKIDDERPLGEVVANKIEEATQQAISETPLSNERVELSLKIDHEGATFEDITRKTSAEAPTERVIEEIPCVQIAAADWLAAPDVRAWVADRKNKVAQLWCGDVFVVFDHGEGPNSPTSEPDHAMPEWLWNKISDVMRKRDVGYAVVRLLNTDVP